MKKKLLFLSTAQYGLYKVFEEGLIKYSGCEVTTITYKQYTYKDRKEKVVNFLSKVFLNKNLKKIKGSAQYLEGLDEHYDYLLMISPHIVLPKFIEQLTKKATQTIAYYWDGFDHFPESAATIKYFQRPFTFDPVDAEKYNINFLPNFYFYNDRETNFEYDLFFLASYDVRYPLITKIAKSLEHQNKKAVIKLYAAKNTALPKDIPLSVAFIDKHISFDVTKEHMRKSRLILDIHKDVHTGLSFRVFEAMGLGKKLITTNQDVVNYDFYNPNNIFVWTEQTESLPAEFLATHYQELPEHVYRKYSQESWVKTILDIKD